MKNTSSLATEFGTDVIQAVSDSNATVCIKTLQREINLHDLSDSQLERMRQMYLIMPGATLTELIEKDGKLYKISFENRELNKRGWFVLEYPTKQLTEQNNV